MLDPHAPFQAGQIREQQGVRILIRNVYTGNNGRQYVSWRELGNLKREGDLWHPEHNDHIIWELVEEPNVRFVNQWQ